MTKPITLFSRLQSILLALLIVSLTSVSASESFKLKELTKESESGDIDLKLYVFNCGDILIRDLSLFNPAIAKNTVKDFSNSCYLIVHPKGNLLWDTGLPDALIDQANGTDVFDGAFNLSVTTTLRSQLDAINIDPLTIDYLAISHLHGDHSGNANYFKNAKWLIQEVEYNIAMDPDAALAAGFTPTDYTELNKDKVRLLNGHYDVFGDKSVVIISTPGHTPGHQVLYLDLPDSGKIILSGDLYHFLENRNTYGIPVFNSSIRESVHSFVLLDNVLDDTKAKLWIQHDKPFFDTRNLSPGYYQ